MLVKDFVPTKMAEDPVHVKREARIPLHVVVAFNRSIKTR